MVIIYKNKLKVIFNNPWAGIMYPKTFGFRIKIKLTNENAIKDFSKLFTEKIKHEAITRVFRNGLNAQTSVASVIKYKCLGLISIMFNLNLH